MAVGRFQVMATLQAARALSLSMSEEMAKSWGLNRAIFYAAAKRGFRGKRAPRRKPGEVKLKPVKETPRVYHLGDEMAYKKNVGRRTYFSIGGQAQKPEDFERQIEARFGGRFTQAWKEALQIVGEFDREVLLSQSAFYEMVYKPRRDDLATKWSRLPSE